jgi:threonine dehydrogenase-like Zn-dependent dehydrogenase
VDLKEVMTELGMVGGFDVGLELSGSPQAFTQMLDTMYHGGRIALLGLLPNGTGIDWDKVIFKGLFLKGIYGREICLKRRFRGDLVQNGGDDPLRFEYRRRHHPPLPLRRLPKGLRGDDFRGVRQGRAESRLRGVPLAGLSPDYSFSIRIEAR